MRRKTLPYGYILCFALVLALISTPIPLAMRLRGAVIATLTPIWSSFAVLNPFSAKKEQNRQIDLLQLENQQLKEQLSIIGQAYTQSAQIALSSDSGPLTAKVVYRPFDSWNHSLWIDIGWEDITRKEEPILAKDSPVVLGDAVVGVVDYVGKRHSRVRLLSDPGVVPSVRVARGKAQALSLLYSVEEILERVNEQTELLEQSPNSRLHLLTSLETLKAELVEEESAIYLAKGELCGIRGSKRHRGSFLLSGRGFNYDFPDQYGPSRDLRSGRVEGTIDSTPIPLIQPHDMLVTTGMDGIFPAGLRVATVTEVFPLREGAYSYDITAKPAATTLETLTTVFILPPQVDPLIRNQSLYFE